MRLQAKKNRANSQFLRGVLTTFKIKLIKKVFEFNPGFFNLGGKSVWFP